MKQCLPHFWQKRSAGCLFPDLSCPWIAVVAIYRAKTTRKRPISAVMFPALNKVRYLPMLHITLFDEKIFVQQFITVF